MTPQGDHTGRREALIRLARAGGLGAGVTGVALRLAGRSRYPEEPTAPYIQRNVAVKPDPGWPELAVI